jgi:acyl carrier protein
MGLDTVELVMAFEEKFGINIPNEDAAELTTPRKVTDYVMSTAKSEGMTRDEVAAIVRSIIEETTAVSDFHEDSHFVYDMNLD